MVDLNVILDVVQNRSLHYTASAQVLSKIRADEVVGVLPGHALTTLHYIIGKSSGSQKANETIDWLLQYFEIARADKAAFLKSRAFSWDDFEDAVVAVCAETSGSDYIVTRNATDFSKSPIKAISPNEFLEKFGEAST